MIEAAQKANEQRWAVFNALQRDFLGSPPAFDDAVGVYLLADDGRIQVLSPRNWINDNDARLMLTTGRSVSGMILVVSETSIPGRLAVTTSQIDVVDRKVPLQTAQQVDRDVPDAIAVATDLAKPKERRGSDHEIRVAVNEYKQTEVAAGRQPNMDRAVDYVLAQFSRAGRDRVRQVFRDVVGHRTRGRPSKSRA